MTIPAETPTAIHPELKLISEADDHSVRAAGLEDDSEGRSFELPGDVAALVSGEMERTGQSFADILKRWIESSRNTEAEKFDGTVNEAIRDVEKMTGWPRRLILAEAVWHYSKTISLACDAAAQNGRAGCFGFAKAKASRPNKQAKPLNPR